MLRDTEKDIYARTPKPRRPQQETPCWLPKTSPMVCKVFVSVLKEFLTMLVIKFQMKSNNLREQSQHVTLQTHKSHHVETKDHEDAQLIRRKQPISTTGPIL